MSNSESNVETRSEINDVPKNGDWYQIVNNDVSSDVFCAIRWDEKVGKWNVMTIEMVNGEQVVDRKYYDDRLDIAVPKPSLNF